MTGFYSHRKTARLRAIIGDDAFWLPPRVWAYAAENQPDGDLSGYAAPELAMLVGYSKDATSMLQALKDCGFIDFDGMIHGWMEHNGYHDKFAKRAKTAAAARWGNKENPPTPPKETNTGKGKGERGDKHCLEHATSMLVASKPDASLSLSSQIREIFDAWNELGTVPKCLVVSDKRRQSLKVRLNDPFFLANWREAMRKVKESRFCQGESGRGWRASFDFFIAPDSVPKIMEGKYDNNGHKTESKQLAEQIDVKSIL